MKKRKIEVFTAGCPCCDEAVRVVKSIACDNCDVQILDMQSRAGARRGVSLPIIRPCRNHAEGQFTLEVNITR